MALIGCRADDWIGTGANAYLTRIRLCAAVVVVANSTVGFDWVRTNARIDIARACGVALIGCRADDRIGTRANTGLTRIRLRARISVIANGTVGFGRIRARARVGIARTDHMALIGRRADDGVRP
jgi:hypothetical protein